MRRKITQNQIHLDLYQYNSARTNVDPLLTFFKIDTEKIVSKIFKNTKVAEFVTNHFLQA